MGGSLLAVMSAESRDYWYCGASNVWSQVSCYTYDEKQAQPAAELPGSSDVIWLRGNESYYIDDATIGFFANVGGVHTRYINTTVNIRLANDASFGCYIGDFGQRGLTNQFIVKTGPGNLSFSRAGGVNGSGLNWLDYNIGLDVREGEVFLEPNNGKSRGRHYHGPIIIAEGCTVHAVTNADNYLVALAGAGTIVHDGTTETGAQLSLTGNIWAPGGGRWKFSGKISGLWSIVTFGGRQDMIGTANDFTGTTRVANYDGGENGTTGFMAWSGPSGAMSSLGPSSSIDARSSGRLVYLGNAHAVVDRSLYAIWDTSSAPFTIDGGAHGDLLWTGSFNPRTSEAKQQRLCLAGSNAVVCVLSNAWTKVSLTGTNCSFHVTKTGSGTWRFLHHPERNWTGALSVKEGTVEFDTIGEQGELCALGLATELYEDKCDYPANLATVDSAWTLGTTGDLTKVGTLSYVGDTDMVLQSRSTALAGAGRLKTKQGSLLKYTAGVSGVGSGEREIRFENGAGATNVVSGVSDGTDGATVSVVKEGAGVYELTGDLGFTGDVIVKAGELRIRDINDKPYRWFRYTFKENRCSSTNAAYSALSVSTGNNYAGRATRALSLNEIGLYDDMGKRLTKWSKVAEVVTNDRYFTLQSNQVALKDPALVRMVDADKDDFRQLFDNNQAGGGICWTCWSDRYLYPQFDKPESWFVVYQRVDDAAAEAVSYDLCYAGHSGKDAYKGGPTAYAIEGSVDGIHFEEIVSTNNVVYSPASDSSYGWLSNNGTDTGWTESTLPENVAHPKLPLAATRQVQKFARPVPRSVGVAPGAKLVFDGTSLTTAGVTLGTDGLGTVSGVKLAAEGTVNLVCDLSDRPKKVFFPADFSQFGDSDNVLGYTVTVNGGTLPRAYAASVAPNGVTLTRKGFALVVR